MPITTLSGTLQEVVRTADRISGSAGSVHGSPGRRIGARWAAGLAYAYPERRWPGVVRGNRFTVLRGTQPVRESSKTRMSRRPVGP